MAKPLITVTTRAVDESDAPMNDLSKAVERLEAMEDKMGIHLSGVFAAAASKPDSDGEYGVEVNSALMLTKGKKLSDDTTIKAVCYDAAGRVMGTGEQWVREENFHGYDAFSMNFYVKGLVSKIRLFPTGG